jgi:cytochrome P450
VTVANFRRHHHTDTDVDISSLRFWSGSFDERERSFARLRAVAPVSWHPQLETPGLAKKDLEAGFWAVTQHADVSFVSRRPDLFSSAIGRVSLRPAPFSVIGNMLVLDPPTHSAYRRIVSGAFTAGAVRKVEPRIGRWARQIVRQAIWQREFDFVSTVAAKIPARPLAIILGLPASEHDQFVIAADAYAGAGVSASVANGVGVAEFFEQQSYYLRELCLAMSAYRREHPAGDIMTRLVQGEVAGRRLTDDEIFSTVLLLSVAGHATTKNALALSMLALEGHPEQRRWLLDDFDTRFPDAFEELMRYTSPILAFARTATRDVSLGGKAVSSGDKVAMFYCSANRDESVFERADTLDLARSTNSQVAFGGGGVHFCLGSILARVQIKAVLRELYGRTAGIELKEAVYGFSDFMHTVESLAVRVEPTTT